MGRPGRPPQLQLGLAERDRAVQQTLSGTLDSCRWGFLEAGNPRPELKVFLVQVTHNFFL